MEISRVYTIKDVDMIVGAKTVAENFITHKDQIIPRRSVWADPFIEDFATRIDSAAEEYLGLDTKKDLKAATGQVVSLGAAALKDLGFLKIQIEADFDSDKKEMKQILNKLGFNGTYKLAKRGDQQALTQVLFKFKKGMTDEMKTTLTTKGIDATLIEDIKGYEKVFTAANVAQEKLKGSSKTLTAAGIAEFNEIYKQAIAICRICANLFAADKLVKDQFSFSRIVSNMGNQKSTKVETEIAA